MRRRLWLVLILLCLLPRPARAVDPDRRISQYAHTTWRVQDGVFNSSPTIVAQTQDGYLWLGTKAGLLRFDGVRFVPWQSLHGEQLPSPWIQDLLAASDGSLWIATTRGLSRLKNQTLTNYTSGAGTGGIDVLMEDHNRTIWFSQRTQGTTNPKSESLCHVLDAGVRCLGTADGMPAIDNAQSLIEDAEGNLWLGGSTTLLRWSPTSHAQYQTTGLRNNSAGSGVVGLAATPEGNIWVGIAKAGSGLGLQRLVQGRWQPFTTPQIDGSTLQVSALRLDREGALWIGTADHGIYRLHDDNVDHFDSTHGLSSDFVMWISEDHEGSLWVTTTLGVDRFSDTAVKSFSSKEGLCSTEVDTVLATRDGSIWIGGDGALSHLQHGRVSCLRTGKGLRGTQVTSLLEDHAGQLWVGVDNTLWIYNRGTSRKVTRPDGSEIGFVTGIAEDSENSVWVAVSGPPRIVMRIQSLTVREELHEPQMPRRVAAASTGGIWLGTVSGDLAHYHDGKLATYRFPHDAAALLNQLLPMPDGSVLAATSYGLIGWHHGKLLNLAATNGLPCDNVNAMTLDRDGNLWLFMECALGVMARSDLQRWKDNPEMRVSIRTFDVLDGVRSGWAAFNAGATSSDGTLWFASGAVLQMIDPAHLRRNSVSPPVHIEQIVADRKRFPVAGAVHLPPLTRDLEIDYVGLSFVAPQKVLFRYWLEGRDSAWQEPGTRRQAFYTDLRPGTYRFRVIASNNDGLWNEEGAALDFVVEPAWYQTKAFLMLFLMTGIFAVWVAVRLRMRQLARALNARFEERLAERTRVARDLHDTLLQTVHGSRIVADAALTRPDDANGMKHAVEQLSAWLRQASEEGRAAVNSLRASTTERNDLTEAFHRAIEDCRRQGSIEGSLSVIGSPGEMHPIVRDEVYRIGYEAIRNACTHSGGTRVEVGLRYADELILRVADNGVGIASSVSDGGKEGHFGLRGMQERATRIGANFTVATAERSGTEIVLTVPGRVIFDKPTAGLFDRLRRSFGGRSHTVV